MDALSDKVEFQSALPVWGATAASRMTILIVAFQSALPVWGATIVSRMYSLSR